MSKLLSLARGPLGLPMPARPPSIVNDELAAMLRCCNGFYAFESALHVRHSGRTPQGFVGLEEWNSYNAWRNSYGDMADSLFFFGEDIFGAQFALTEKGEVSSFDPETGDTHIIATRLEGWASLLLDDYPTLTGHPVAHEWQSQHGPIDAGSRLVPTIPFVLGGEFTSSNLYPLDATEGMRMRGALARQIRDRPDGQMVRFRSMP